MYLLSNIFISESNVLHNDKVSTWVICLDAADVKKKKKKKKKKRRRKELRFCLGPEWGRLVSSLAYSCSAEQIICSADENAFAKQISDQVPIQRAVYLANLPKNLPTYLA